MLIRFFDWGDNENPNIAASTTNGDENTADCYCVGNPLNWWHWDVSICKLPDDEAHKLAVKLARLWAIMYNMENYLP